MPAYRGGIDGLKTGTTDKAGASFVGTTVEKECVSLLLF